MKKYIVCVNNIYDNDMKMIKVNAEDEKIAIVIAVGDNPDTIEDFENLTIGDLQQYYFDADMLVSDAIEI